MAEKTAYYFIGDWLAAKSRSNNYYILVGLTTPSFSALENPTDSGRIGEKAWSVNRAYKRTRVPQTFFETSGKSFPKDKKFHLQKSGDKQRLKELGDIEEIQEQEELFKIKK